MADLDNLLDEINHGDSSTNNDYAQRTPLPYDREDGRDDSNEHSSEQASIAATLTGTTATRLQSEEENSHFGGGNERLDDNDDENDDVSFDKADVDGRDDHGRKINHEYEQLKGLWTSELACPELLPHDAETVMNVEKLTNQEDDMEKLLPRSKQQRQSSREVGAAGGEIASLVEQIRKMDLDRTRFMLVDLARSRMAKIENHPFHNRTLLNFMTEDEKYYLRQYGELLEKHYQRTVLNHLPKEAWKKLDESEMIDLPDLEQFVFCHVLKTVQIDVTGEPNPLKNASSRDVDGDEIDSGDNLQEHCTGSYLMAMYWLVRELVSEGKVELVL